MARHSPLHRYPAIPYAAETLSLIRREMLPIDGASSTGKCATHTHHARTQREPRSTEARHNSALLPHLLQCVGR